MKQHQKKIPIFTSYEGGGLVFSSHVSFQPSLHCSFPSWIYPKSEGEAQDWAGSEQSRPVTLQLDGVTAELSPEHREHLRRQVWMLWDYSRGLGMLAESRKSRRSQSLADFLLPAAEGGPFSQRDCWFVNLTKISISSLLDFLPETNEMETRSHCNIWSTCKQINMLQKGQQRSRRHVCRWPVCLSAFCGCGGPKSWDLARIGRCLPCFTLVTQVKDHYSSDVRCHLGLF